MQSNKLAMGAAVVVGLIFVVIGILYIATPASGLPGFLPGHEPGSAIHHTKHGLLAIALGVCAFVAARFVGGPSGNANVG